MAHMIRIAYRFLSQHYEQGDRIFLFGFSRGAFAARSLAGFVDCVGLALRTLPPSVLNQAIDDAYYIYEFLQGDADAIRKGITHHLKGGSRSRNDVRDLEWVSLPICFIGIWDAVEALGLPAEAKAVTRVFNSYHQTRLPPNITHAAHATPLPFMNCVASFDHTSGMTNWRNKRLCSAGFQEITATSAGDTAGAALPAFRSLG